jgi:FkbM family methyltransferase
MRRKCCIAGVVPARTYSYAERSQVMDQEGNSPDGIIAFRPRDRRSRAPGTIPLCAFADRAVFKGEGDRKWRVASGKPQRTAKPDWMKKSMRPPVVYINFTTSFETGWRSLGRIGGRKRPPERARNGTSMQENVQTNRGLSPKVVSMQQWVICRAIEMFGFYFRHFPHVPGNGFVLNQLINRTVRYCTRSNPIEMQATTLFGENMILRLPEAIDSRICFFGVWEPAITAYLTRGLSCGDIFIDIGANIGYYSLLAAKIVGPKGHVYAIEASPQIFARLKHNLTLNSFENVTATNVAAAGESGQVAVYTYEDDNVGMTTMIESELSRHHRFEAIVKCQPFYEIVPWRVVEAARFIKIDVEGAEWVIIKSIEDKLGSLSDRTEIIVEISRNAIEKCGGSVDELVQIFGRAGFDAFRIPNTYMTSEYTKGFSADLVPFIDLNLVDKADLIFKKPGGRSRIDQRNSAASAL